VTESHPERVGAGQSHPGSSRSASGLAPGHLDLTADAADQALAPGAAEWAQSLLEVARFELARADDKANTMFRFYGVVAALSIGLLAGKGWSPSELAPVAQGLFWAGCTALVASGVFLGWTLYPRDIRGTPARRLLYFGHVIAFQSVTELTDALNAVEHDRGGRLVEQLLGVSRLVHKKYALMRRALTSLAFGAFACLAAVILSAATN
jgi:hypothetical protein